MTSQTDDIPLLIAGPILRRITPDRFTCWLATSHPVDIRLTLDPPEDEPHIFQLEKGAGDSLRILEAGTRLHFVLINLKLGQPLPQDRLIDYALQLRPAGARGGAAHWRDITADHPHLLYPGRDRLSFRLASKVTSLLHGSCRKPHHQGADGLVEGDRLLESLLHHHGDQDTGQPDWPAFLLMSGDQIYADDVAGPMLKAIHDICRNLGLHKESFTDTGHDRLADSDALLADPHCYYQREELLPKNANTRRLREILFGGVRKPVFTSDTSENHLITLAEHLAMYLLVWSPLPWQLTTPRPPAGLGRRRKARLEEEQHLLQDFRAGLPRVQRLLAHLPVAMIFDDHDISDDWNLNREWEDAVYNNAFSRRMVGNGLAAYLLAQGWGNNPDAFDTDLMDCLADTLKNPGGDSHDGCTERLLRFEGWNFTWEGSPALVVLDTRTRRWRSETSMIKPSGLLDWEALTDLQQEIRGRDAVILASSAPIFGVKLIENLQGLFTWAGKPLVVDAENWMAHPGTAHAILNVFLHPKTPQNFVILSGDVHYSFVYDVEIRRYEQGPDIWQICSSGLRNEFPRRLLDTLDVINRFLYAPRSPLNWLTKRRRMRVVPRKPDGLEHGRRLLNGSGIGLVELDEAGRPQRIRQLLADGHQCGFTPMEDHAQFR